MSATARNGVASRLLTPIRAGMLSAVGGGVAGALTLHHALVGAFYDDGLYAGIAVALGKGMGYVHPHLPGTPAAVHYPPLYPLVLTPLFALFPVPTAALLGQILNVFLAALGAGLVTAHAVRIRLLGDDAPTWLAPACVLGAAIAIPVLAVQSVLFSEPLFTVLLAAGVMLVDRSRDRPRAVRAALVGGVLAALALLTRSIALAAAAGMPAFLLFVRRRPLAEVAAVVLPLLLAAVGWGAWTELHRRGIDPAIAMNYGSYTEVIRQDGFHAFGRRAPDLLRPLAAITVGWIPWRPFYYLAAAAGLGVFLFGMWLVVRRSAIGFTLVAYFAILAVWPYQPDRFVWAVLPWLALIWMAGAVRIHQAYRRWRIPLAVTAVVGLAGFVQLEIRGIAGRWWRSQQDAISANFRELLPGLASLPPGAVLASDDEALVWLYNRRPTVPFYIYAYRQGVEVRATPESHRAYLERQGVTHVLLSGFGSGSDQEMDALLGAFPGWLTMVRAWPGGRALFRVNRGG